MTLICTALSLTCAFAAIGCGPAAMAGQYSTIPFPGAPGPSEPEGGLVADASGTLYGTTPSGGRGGGGSIYSLTQAGVFTTLHSFGGYPDGYEPFSTLTLGPDGTLYGVTPTGGTMNGGVVFSLSPPPAGKTQWTYKNLHAFNSSNGCYQPSGVLYLAPSGQLYGVTESGDRHSSFGGGVVYQLTPPAAGTTAWQFHVMYAFSSVKTGDTPYAGVIADTAGVLYGTTYSSGLTGGNLGQGVIYSLTPPASGQTAWTEAVLHVLNGPSDGGSPSAELVRDAVGNLYGTTQVGGAQGGGTAFELSPPTPGQSQWTYTVLYAFGGAGGETGSLLSAPLLPDGLGGFYSTTQFGGTDNFGLAFHLSPPATGQSQWTETVLHDFANVPTDGIYPGAGGFLLQNDLLVNTTVAGPDSPNHSGYGTVYKLQP